MYGILINELKTSLLQVICFIASLPFTKDIFTSAKEVMFLPVFVCLSVCLSVCQNDNSKSYAWLFLKI